MKDSTMNCQQLSKQRNDHKITKLKATIQSTMNPMTYNGEDLPNMTTNIVMQDEIANDLCVSEMKLVKESMKNLSIRELIPTQ